MKSKHLFFLASLAGLFVLIGCSFHVTIVKATPEQTKELATNAAAIKQIEKQ